MAEIFRSIKEKIGNIRNTKLSRDHKQRDLSGEEELRAHRAMAQTLRVLARVQMQPPKTEAEQLTFAPIIGPDVNLWGFTWNEWERLPLSAQMAIQKISQ